MGSYPFKSKQVSTKSKPLLRFMELVHLPVIRSLKAINNEWAKTFVKPYMKVSGINTKLNHPFILISRFEAWVRRD